MTRLNLDIPNERYFRILISIMQGVREMDLPSTTITEINQTAKTATDDNLYYFKDHLDFQIAKIESLAG